MTLRVRLSLAFGLVVLVPVLIGSILVGRGVPQAVQRQVDDRLQAGRAGVTAVVAQLCEAAQLTAEVVGLQAGQASAAQAVRTVVSSGSASAAAIVNARGRVLALAAAPDVTAAPSSWVALAPVGSCRGSAVADGAVVGASVQLTGRTGSVGRAVVLLPLSAARLRTLASGSGVDVTILSGGHVLMSTLPAPAARRVQRAGNRLLGSQGAADVGGLRAAADRAGGGFVVAVSTDRPSATGLEAALFGITVAALLMAGLIGWQLARVTTRPLVELSDAAVRVASGDLGTHIAVRSRDEVGRLAAAFNDMTHHLHGYVSALESSRDELRRSLSRLGETLSSTHDLNRILEVIVETAMASIRARAGAVMLSSPGRGELYLKVARGLGEVDPNLRVPMGVGVSGSVAARGEALLVRGPGTGPEPAPGEPTARTLVAVPLKVSGKVIGLLNLYDRVDGESFEEGDLETIRSFASQATVAIDNVLLHQEAQRLSITDGLTGLWNYRYFQMNFGKEIERAARFGRSLAVLMLDIDHFKRVNDAYGHQRGDSVLVDLATRVKGQIREVDILARYGGEEFVLVLPETDLAGAERTAERICDVVRGRPFGGTGEAPLRVTISIGIAVFPGNATTATELVGAADAALYDAKRSGRDSWRVAHGGAPAASAVIAPPAG